MNTGMTLPMRDTMRKITGFPSFFPASRPEKEKLCCRIPQEARMSSFSWISLITP